MHTPTIPPKWEDYLRKGVIAVGLAVEKVVEGVEKVAENYGKSGSSIQPILSLEGQLSIPKLKELINISSEGFIPATSLVDKTAIEIREGPAVLAPKFLERGSSVAVHINMGGGIYGSPPKNIYSIKCSALRLPFEDGFFDHAVAVLANQYQGDIVESLKEISRVLTIGGDGVVIDFHPFGLYAKRGSLHLKPAGSVARGIEDYYKICRSAGLKIIEVREAFLDEAARPLFVTDEEKAAFKMVKDTPLLICVFVRKGG